MNTIDQKKQKLVLVGCLCLMLAIASHGLALATIQGPVLESLGGADLFASITVLSAIAICVMTPIGGRLATLMGPGKLILLFGTISVVSGLIMSFTSVLWLFVICRVILAISQGAYSSLPFVIINTTLPQDQSPKWIGYLSIMSSIGSVGGSFLSGFFQGHGMSGIAMAFPLLFVVGGMLLIGMNMKDVPVMNIQMDWMGIVLLTAALGGCLMGLNNGPVQGWFSLPVLVCFTIGMIGFLSFVWWEDKTPNALMPMSMFRIKEFSLILLIGFLLAFYMNALSTYIPLGAQQIMGVSTAQSGLIQLPKAALMLFIPAIAGTWVVKNKDNVWKALLIAGISLVIAFGMMVFIGVKMPLWFLMMAVALTAFSDAYRSVGLLPSVQRVLDRKDMGVGTSMIGFIMTLSGSIASAFFGLCYNSLTAATPGVRGMTDGIDTICLLTALVSLIAVVLVILFLKPMLKKKDKEAASA